MANYTRIPMEERFWKKVNKHGPVVTGMRTRCWEWIGNLSSTGYGVIALPGRGSPRVLAHRYSYELKHGPFDKSLFVLHHCDNPLCVRPSHLYTGSQAQNMRDMKVRGRSNNGNRAKTHCPRGHPYKGDNLGVNANGGRYCKACKRDRRLVSKS